MEADKVISNVIIFGGIGAMAYLLLKKKPVVEQKSTTTTFVYNPVSGNTTEQTIYNSQKALACAEGISKDWIKVSPSFVANCVSLQGNNELTQPLVDQTTLSLNPSSNLITNRFYTGTGDVRPNSCIELDWFIKSISKDLQFMYSSGSGSISSSFIPYYEKVKKDAEDKFAKFNCRDKIEAQRTKDFVAVQSKGDIQAEQSILTKSFTDQKTYIILGGLVLLTGFYIVVKK